MSKDVADAVEAAASARRLLNEAVQQLRVFLDVDRQRGKSVRALRDCQFAPPGLRLLVAPEAGLTVRAGESVRFSAAGGTDMPSVSLVGATSFKAADVLRLEPDATAGRQSLGVVFTPPANAPDPERKLGIPQRRSGGATGGEGSGIHGSRQVTTTPTWSEALRLWRAALRGECEASCFGEWCRPEVVDGLGIELERGRPTRLQIFVADGWSLGSIPDHVELADGGVLLRPVRAPRLRLQCATIKTVSDFGQPFRGTLGALATDPYDAGVAYGVTAGHVLGGSMRAALAYPVSIEVAAANLRLRPRILGRMDSKAA